MPITFYNYLNDTQYSRCSRTILPYLEMKHTTCNTAIFDPNAVRISTTAWAPQTEGVLASVCMSLIDVTIISRVCILACITFGYLGFQSNRRVSLQPENFFALWNQSRSIVTHISGCISLQNHYVLRDLSPKTAGELQQG